MATKSSATETKLTAAQLKKKVETQEEKIKSLKEGAWCYMCDTHKARDKFYVSTDPMNKSGLTPICKDCARKIALKIGKDKVEHEPDKSSVIETMRYLNKPFLSKLWDASIQESENLASGKVRSNGYYSYVKNVAMGQYNTMKQLALDESEWSDMVSEMRVVNTGLRKEKDAYQEINRILLRENLDLRDTLKENNLLNEEQLKDLKDVYSVFAEFDEVEESPDDETKEVTENESE